MRWGKTDRMPLLNLSLERDGFSACPGAMEKLFFPHRPILCAKCLLWIIPFIKSGRSFLPVGPGFQGSAYYGTLLIAQARHSGDRQGQLKRQARTEDCGIDLRSADSWHRRGPVPCLTVGPGA